MSKLVRIFISPSKVLAISDGETVLGFVFKEIFLSSLPSVLNQKNLKKELNMLFVCTTSLSNKGESPLVFDFNLFSSSLNFKLLHTQGMTEETQQLSRKFLRKRALSN